MTSKFEWKNGDECVYMNSKIIHVVIGRDDKYRDSFWCKSPCGNINRLDASCLSKPETPQQREERERLEAAYDLYCIMCGIEGYAKFDLTDFSKTKKDSAVWLAIVDKTNYRK